MSGFVSINSKVSSVDVFRYHLLQHQEAILAELQNLGVCQRRFAVVFLQRRPPLSLLRVVPPELSADKEMGTPAGVIIAHCCSSKAASRS